MPRNYWVVKTCIIFQWSQYFVTLYFICKQGLSSSHPCATVTSIVSWKENGLHPCCSKQLIDKTSILINLLDFVENVATNGSEGSYYKVTATIARAGPTPCLDTIILECAPKLIINPNCMQIDVYISTMLRAMCCQHYRICLSNDLFTAAR